MGPPPVRLRTYNIEYIGDNVPCTRTDCIEHRQQLKEAWEMILRLDVELHRITEILTAIEADRAAQTERV